MSLLAVAVFEMIVPAAVAALTLTTSVNTCGAPIASVLRVAVTVPVPPTAGDVIVQPAGPATETKVVFAGHRVGQRHAVAAARSGVGHRHRIGQVRARQHRIGSVRVRHRQIRTDDAPRGRGGLRVGVVGGVRVGRGAGHGRRVRERGPKNVTLLTLTIMVKTALAPAANVARDAGGPPEGCRSKVGPEFWTNSTKVVLTGIATVRLTPVASLGPVFETVMV